MDPSLFNVLAETRLIIKIELAKLLKEILSHFLVEGGAMQLLVVLFLA